MAAHSDTASTNPSSDRHTPWGVNEDRILEAGRQRFKDTVLGLMPNVLDRVDDALFRMAEKSETNQSQALYFDAMREVRLKRPGMAQTFKSALAQNINKRIKTLLQRHTGQPSAPLGSSLGLIDNDELEESLAVGNMSAKVRDICDESLFGLDQRVGHLLGIRDLAGTENPLGPETLCEAVKESVDHIDSGIEVRLIILKLFDRFFVEHLPDVYRDIDTLLVRRGVLPQLPRTIKKNPHTTARRNTHPPDNTDAAGSTGENAHTGPVSTPGGEYLPSDRVAPMRQTGDLPGTAAPIVIQPGVLLAAMQQFMRSGPGGQTVSVPQIALDNLDQAQHQVAGESLSAPIPNRLRDLKAFDWAKTMTRGDQIVIDVIAMMFDYVLEDASIPDSVKALISRLQIPYLKVAIIDKTLFSRKFHPARRLLNRLSVAAIGCPAEKPRADPVFAKIAQTVNSVLDDYADDVSLFARLDRELEIFLNEHQAGAKQAADKAATKLKRRERTRAARLAARLEVEKRLRRFELPTLIHCFLERYWQGLLVITHARRGPDGGEWRVAVKTMDELIWSVRPQKSQEDRILLIQRLPKLLKRLNDGMRLVSMPLAERDATIAELASCHAAIVNPDSEIEQVLAAEADEAVDLEETTEQPFTEPSGAPAGEDLAYAVRAANLEIFEHAQCHRECHSMGTTLVAIHCLGERAYLANVGDSRIYRLRDRTISQLTRDHSLRQELLERGLYTAEEAANSKNKNYVTRALGINTQVQVDVQAVEVRDGDMFLLCSDGLSDLVDDDSILAACDSDTDAAATVNRLIVAANEAGGHDNISVVLIRANRGTTGMTYSFAQATDAGRRRERNEDCLLSIPDFGLGVVADGMGGHNAGEVASRLAVHRVAQKLNPTGRYDILPVALDEDTETTEEHSTMAGIRPGDDFMRALLKDQALEIDEIPADQTMSDSISADDTEYSAEQPSDEHRRLAAGTEIGTWLEFTGSDGKASRARLAWISSVTGELLFTNSSGHKVSEHSIASLAELFRKNQVTRVDGVPVFDRAMKNMMARLEEFPGSA